MMVSGSSSTASANESTRERSSIERGPYPEVEVAAHGRWKRGIIRHCMNDPQPEGQMASHIERRKFLATLGGAAAAWPLSTCAQRPPMPVIGFLDGASADGRAVPIAAFRRGLKEAGYVESQNVAIEFRFAGTEAVP